MFLTNLNAEIVACIYYYSENRATSQIWKVLPNMVFPPILGGGGGNGGVLSMRMQAIPDFLFARPGSVPMWGREERRVQGLDCILHILITHHWTRSGVMRWLSSAFNACR